MIELKELTDLEILQMQWSILEEVKKQRRNCNDVTITFKPASEIKEENLPKSNVQALPNGLKLAQSQCREYKEVRYGGNGDIRTGRNQPFPLSVNQVLDLMRNFNNIPRNNANARKLWAEEKYGVLIHSFDRILWNIWKGSFSQVFEDYYNKNYCINFDANGNLILGE